jgi:hypothetical protein
MQQPVSGELVILIAKLINCNAMKQYFVFGNIAIFGKNIFTGVGAAETKRPAAGGERAAGRWCAPCGRGRAAARR